MIGTISWNSPVRGESVLKMLGLVVLCRKGSFVQCMLSRMGLRCGLDIHERHRRRRTPAGRGTAAPAAAAWTGTGTALIALAKGTAGTSIHGTLLAPWQQLDALHASIPITIKLSFNKLQCFRRIKRIRTVSSNVFLTFFYNMWPLMCVFWFVDVSNKAFRFQVKFVEINNLLRLVLDFLIKKIRSTI